MKHSPPQKPVAAAKPITVEEINRRKRLCLVFNDVVLGIGVKGPIFSKDKVIRVGEVRDGLPGKDIWLFSAKTAHTWSNTIHRTSRSC